MKNNCMINKFTDEKGLQYISVSSLNKKKDEWYELLVENSEKNILYSDLYVALEKLIND